MLARLRRRQHPQRHGHADGRHRSAGTARHAPLCARMALPHPQRPLAVRPAAQVQRRLRRRRQDRRAGGHQRHRLRRGRGEGRLWRRARRLVSARARRHHRPQGFCQGHRHRRSSPRTRPWSPMPSCASSSKPATAPTAQGAAEIRARQHGASTNSCKLVEEQLGRKLTRVPAEAMLPRPAFDRMAHIGVHPQKQAGLNWIGVVLPVGKLTCEQMRGLAKIAQDLGDGDIRLTVWQNLLISGVRDENVALATAAIESARPRRSKARTIRAGLVACTGNAGCKFAASDTKRHAAAIGDWCETARRCRHAAQHPSDRLPSLLRAALHQRHRPDRGQGAGAARMTTRSRAITSSPAAASGPMPISGRRSIATSRPRMRRRPSSGC